MPRSPQAQAIINIIDAMDTLAKAAIKAKKAGERILKDLEKRKNDKG